ncbi:MAG: DoxX family protein [Candidatus Dormiibacterota bacterium]
MTAVGLLVLRLVIGLMVAAHGGQKVFGWWGGPGMTGWTAGMTRMRIRPPVPWAWASALSELLGGLALALGLLSPLGNFAIVAAMLVAIALVHWPNGFWNGKRGYEFNLALIAAAVALALTGPGPYSVDGLLGFHLPEPLTLIVGTIAALAGVAVAVGTRGPAVEPKPATG